MGYCTNYNLEIIESKNNENAIWDYIEDDYDLSYAVGEDKQSCKWYDHEKDMRDFSLKFEDTLFKLSGEGEESGDLWIKYFKNGKMQKCPAIVTYDEFDESKLK